MRRLILALSLIPLAAFAQEPRKLVVEGDVDASPAEVWKLFTTVEGVTSWMVPKAEVDLRIGGSMRTNYNPKGKVGDAMTITNQILCFDPERMLSLKNVGAPEGFPHAKATKDTWSVIYFEPLDEGKRTRVRVVGLGWGEGPEVDAAYAFFEQGNAWTIKRLQERVKAGKPLGWEQAEGPR